MINEFSEEQIQNARARAGFVEAELKDYSDLMTTSEAFESTMKLLKDQFTALVNTRVIEDLTTMLVDFTQRVAEVGLFDAIMGGGGKEVRQRNTETLLNLDDLSDEDSLFKQNSSR